MSNLFKVTKFSYFFRLILLFFPKICVPLQSTSQKKDEAGEIKFDFGEMAEWSNAAVLKTVDLNGSGGSNPSLSAEKWLTGICKPLFLFNIPKNIPFFLNSGRKRTFAVMSGFARNAISRSAVVPGRRHGHPHNTLIIRYHLFSVWILGIFFASNPHQIT